MVSVLWFMLSEVTGYFQEILAYIAEGKYLHLSLFGLVGRKCLTRGVNSKYFGKYKISKVINFNGKKDQN